MKKTRKKRYTRQMIRPILHMTFIRVVLGLTAGLLWNEFVNIDAVLPMRAFAFLFLGVFFLVMGWIAWLRMDGIKMPVLDRRLFEWRRHPQRIQGDMADYVNEEVVSFDEMEEDEKDFCRLTADLICGAAFLVLSVL